MTPVQWETAHVRAVFEDMVAVLLSTLHPKAERIDGSGGDGGRDIQLRHDDDRLELFQLKSFTGRLSKEHGRRRQVEESLATAAKRNPDSWTLVVPIDPTPGELAWFDGLRAKYPFPLAWNGRVWLDRQMADHPAIVRYYLEGGDSEVVRVLRELGREQAALAGGIPDVMERLGVLGQRFDEASPHYWLDFSRVGDTITVQPRPRYRGAERDHPIMITTEFAFPDTPTGREAAERLQRALDYGDAVVVEADHVRNVDVEVPGQPRHNIPGARVTLGPAGEGTPFRPDGRAVISDPTGATMGSLPLRFDRRQAGLRGGVLAGQDPTGILRLSVEVDTVERKGPVKLQVSQPREELLPGVLLPTLRVLRHLHAPNQLELQVGGSTFMRPTVLPQMESIGDGLLDLVEALERVQAFANTVFPVPRELSYEDFAAIRRADRLVAGEQVSMGIGPGNVTFTLADPQSFEKLLVADTPLVVSFPDGNHSETIAGVEVPLGPAIATLSSATVTNRAELLDTRPWHAGQALTVHLQPAPGGALEVVLARGDKDDPG